MDPVRFPGVAADDVEIAVGVKLCELVRRQPFPQQLQAAGLAIVVEQSSKILAQGANARPGLSQPSAEYDH